jgi:hypothetical protein
MLSIYGEYVALDLHRRRRVGVADSSTQDGSITYFSLWSNSNFAMMFVRYM